MTATSTENKDLTKLTARFFAPMYADFDRQMSKALLRRDAFLDRVIAGEIQNIRTDLDGRVLSAKANRYIAGRLKALGGKNAPPLKQVSIAMRASTADALRHLAEEHNLVRDSLINWIVILLRSSDKLLDWIELPRRVNWMRRDGTEDMPTSPLKAIEETQWDPFYYLRAACERRHGCGLYTLPLPEHLHAFACCLPEDEVPTTTAYEERMAKEREELDLLGDLDAFEAAIPPTVSKK